MLNAVIRRLGAARSWRVYYGDPARDRAMDALHARLVGAGDLVFDVGSHVGDRIASFRRLGCRVVAVEPQPQLVELLRLAYGRDPEVTIVPTALGEAPGALTLHVNQANPTVTTASTAFIEAARDADGWREQVWSKTITVPVDTLDRLIARHGTPAFVKIDVEGFEAVALSGLGRRVPCLSFEFTTIQRDVARAALARLAALGYARFDASLGESQRFLHGALEGPGLDAVAMAAWIDALPHAANSGDVYAWG